MSHARTSSSASPSSSPPSARIAASTRGKRVSREALGKKCWRRVRSRERAKEGAHAAATRSEGTTERRACVVYDVSDRLTPYDEAWDWQKAFLARALERGETSTDVAILLQHPPTITLGTGSAEEHLKFNPECPPDGFDLRRCERGGEATYHGPGQLVLYPILNLSRQPHEMDLHWYMRTLETVALRTSVALGLEEEKCGRVEGLTGAWCDGHKLAAIGVRARRWVTYHGVALNVCPNLAHFANIVPCGIDDKPVGSVAQMLRGESGLISSASGASMSAASNRKADDADDELLLHARVALLNAFADTFGLDLELRGRPDICDRA